MAKLGGIKFGAAPIPMSRLPPPPAREEEEPKEETQEPSSELTEEEEERARKERIAAKLAGMGGMRFGMLPPGVPGSLPSRAVSSTAVSSPSPSSPPPPPSQRAIPPQRVPQPAQESTTDSEYESLSAASDDGVHVEAEESELEEVRHEDAEEPDTPPPPVPNRAGRRSSGSVPPSGASTENFSRHTSQPHVPATRPPIPSALPKRRTSTQTSIPASRKSSAETRHRESSTYTPQAEYVMVESEEATPPPPPARPTSRPPPPRAMPPPPAADPVDSLSSSQWELPSIPSASLDFGAGADLSLSGWSEGSTSSFLDNTPPPPPPKANHQATSHDPTKAAEAHLSSDDLMAVWGRVGVQVCEVATTLFEKSKKMLVGDGSYDGFVATVLSEVPNAAKHAPPAYGYVVYVQSAGSVQKRASEIMPGDILVLHDAKFKGHKGIAAYSQTVGAGEPLVGIVSEFEAKKSKVRVFQANQHVGQQVRIICELLFEFVAMSCFSDC